MPQGSQRGEAVGAGIHQITRNAIADHYRNPRIRRELAAGIDVGEESAGAPEGEAPDVGGKLACCIGPLLKRLTATYREALTLTELDGLSQAEAAAHAGLSPSGMGHSGDDDIVSRLVDLDGNALGGELQISSAGGSKDFPEVAHAGQTLKLGNRVSLAVWADDRDGGRDIWAQVIDSSGAATQGSNFKLSGSDEDLFPAVEYGAIGGNNGRFLVAWTQETSEGESEVYGRLVQGPGGTIGNAVGSAFQISSPSGSTSGSAPGPAIAYDDVNDEFLVVWGDDRGGPAGQRDLWAQRVDTSGNLQGANVRVTSEPGFERGPEIVYHGEQQEYLVVWEGRPDGDFGAATNARGQRLDPSGTPVGPVVEVAATGRHEGPGDLAVNEDTGSYVVPLISGPGPGATPRNRVEVVHVARDGTVVGSPEQVATDTSGNKGPTATAYGATRAAPTSGQPAVSEMMMFWRDARSGPGLTDQDLWGGTIDVQQDTDGDGLLDSWEQDGFVDRNDNGTLDPAVDFDFSTLPADERPDPEHKDLYVEADWMEVDNNNDGDTNDPGEHSHSMAAGAPGSTPTGTPLDAVINVFDNAPVSNPDGDSGIDLHIDVGQMGGGGPIPETTGIDFDSGFEAVKRNNFDPRRQPVFRYALRKHAGSGRAEIWGNDFWWRYSTRTTQATGFMHELGHNLGLRHGGGDNINCKPNYFSIMNYDHQLQGIPPGLVVDYSRQKLPTITEGALDETARLDGGSGGNGYQATFSVGSGGPVVGPNANTADNVPINWDNDSNSGETGSAVTNNDVNRFDQCAGAPSGESMAGFDDWDNIRMNYRASPHYRDGYTVSYLEDADRTDLEDFWRDRFGPPDSALTLGGPGTARPGDSVVYDVEVANGGPGPARAVDITVDWPAGLSFEGADRSPAVNTVRADGSRELVFTVGKVAAGDTATTSLTGAVAHPAPDELRVDVTVRPRNVLGEPRDGLFDTLTTDVLIPDMTVAKGTSTGIGPGEAIDTEITYQNVGDGRAEGVVITDTLPEGVSYHRPLDEGGGPRPDSVIANPDGTTTLRWDIGDVAASSRPHTINYQARPTLLALDGETFENTVEVTFTDANDNPYAPVSTSATTTVDTPEPSGDPAGIGFWRNHSGRWTSETLARIQATDTRFDGEDGSARDGVLEVSEVEAALAPGGGMPDTLRKQLLATYFNLAERRVVSGTAIDSPTANELGLETVADAVVYATDTLAEPPRTGPDGNRQRYDDATRVLDEINNNRSPVY